MTQLPTRLLLGAIAGFTGTAVMTACMARLHRRLPDRDRYPLPPREITGAVVGETVGHEREAVGDAALAAHFAFGVGVGALAAGLGVPSRIGPMAAAGLGVWAASYFGWVPGLRLLRPVTEHPLRRTAIMAGTHLVWGAATAVTLREMEFARATMFAPGPAKDRS